MIAARSVDKLATGFLVFQGIFFGLMMLFAVLAPMDFVSVVLEIPKEALAAILANADKLGDHGSKYVTWAVIDNDNQHGCTVFMAAIALHTGIKVAHKDRTWIFVCFMLCHLCIVVNQTFALEGTYYIESIDADAATTIFGPARVLHSVFLIAHTFFLTTIVMMTKDGTKEKKK